MRNTIMAAMVLGLGWTLGCVAGCAGNGTVSGGRTYPEKLERAALANVQLLRDGNIIEFTNTTTLTFEDATLWANEWFHRDVGDIAPAERVRVRLSEFRDQFGDRFAGGGFFAARVPDRLALVEIEHGAGEARVLTPIVVIDGTAK